MELKLVSIEEHERLEMRVKELELRQTKVEQALEHFMSEPEGWRSISECCPFFIGKKNMPVSVATMKGLIMDWIASGALVLGVNYMNTTKGGFWISVSFLKGATLPKQSRLKKVA